MLRWIAVPMVLAATAAAGDEAERLRLGQAVARTWCADCHAMPGGAPAASDAGPSFAALADSPLDANGLLGALADPHPAMPDPGLSRAQIDAVWAWIESLRL